MMDLPIPGAATSPSRLAVRTFRHVAALLAVLVASVGLPAAAPAQGRRTPLEFTRQGILILEFEAGAGANRKLGRDAADAVRDRMEKLVNERELELLGGRATVQKLELYGVRQEQPPSAGDLEYMSRTIRADEYVVARVDRGPGGVRIAGELRILRDRWTHQPIPPASGPSVEAAADQMARSIAALRQQMVYQRRCENGVRDGRSAQALEAARAGIAAVPRGAFVRACLVSALAVAGVPASERLTAARELLAIDSTSRAGIEGAARALDLLGQREEAGTMWLRLADTAPEDAELAARVVAALLEDGNARRAAPLVTRVVSDHPDDMTLLRLKWRVFAETREWPTAVAVGESLLVKDTLSRADSGFVARLALAHRSAGHALRAVELAARGVARFPGDGRLFSVYAQLVRQESDSVIPRGLAAFPKSAELLALAARDLRAKGRTEEALEATRKAVEIDSTLPQGVLTIAQAEFDLGRPDSALLSLGRALARGEDTTVVVQFALAKGNALLRGANQTKQRGDYERAMRFFSLADSVRPTPQSHFLRGTAALNVSRAALTEAPAATDKAVSCTLARLGAETLAAAREGLTAGQELAPDAARQYLEYVDQLGPFAEKQVASFCAGAP
jgi:tetratricopeptide (TPR) repeat protein